MLIVTFSLKTLYPDETDAKARLIPLRSSKARYRKYPGGMPRKPKEKLLHPLRRLDPHLIQVGSHHSPSLVEASDNILAG
jgi:hypothetical protein